MQRVVLVLPVEPLSVDDSFRVDRWPLHITVVPPFTARVSLAEIVRLVHSVAHDEKPFTVTVGDEALFGRDHDVPVNLIVHEERLFGLQHKLTDALVEAGPGVPRHPFSPHITMKDHARAYAGDSHLIDRLAVVDMAPRSDPKGRRVLAIAPFGSRPA
ncbi:MAG: 2'-5' RNA ligase family protein [Salinibacterium sp.]|nr:2'-5' RNA ligase family protein [Salinibacterium sp.]MBF0673039.1 2'-5' RNA ligase family protein [Salinibacterium sp.]